jgi:hypothetical protein
MRGNSYKSMFARPRCSVPLVNLGCGCSAKRSGNVGVATRDPSRAWTGPTTENWCAEIGKSMSS